MNIHKKIFSADLKAVQSNAALVKAEIEKKTAKNIKKIKHALKLKSFSKNKSIPAKQEKKALQTSRIFKKIALYKQRYKKYVIDDIYKKFECTVKIGKIILICAFIIYLVNLLFMEPDGKADRFALPFDVTENIIEITDYFGPRINPLTGEEGDFHHGVDFALNWHSRVLASADGKVTYAGTNDSLGNYIMIRHRMKGKTFYTLYGHLSAMIAKEGDHVDQGQTIGLEGGEQGKDANPGSSTGHHLHFAMLDKDEKYIDPKNYLSEL